MNTKHATDADWGNANTIYVPAELGYGRVKYDNVQDFIDSVKMGINWYGRVFHLDEVSKGDSVACGDVDVELTDINAILHMDNVRLEEQQTPAKHRQANAKPGSTAPTQKPSRKDTPASEQKNKATMKRRRDWYQRSRNIDPVTGLDKRNDITFVHDPLD